MNPSSQPRSNGRPAARSTFAFNYAAAQPPPPPTLASIYSAGAATATDDALDDNDDDDDDDDDDADDDEYDNWDPRRPSNGGTSSSRSSSSDLDSGSSDSNASDNEKDPGSGSDESDSDNAKSESASAFSTLDAIITPPLTSTAARDTVRQVGSLHDSVQADRYSGTQLKLILEMEGPYPPFAPLRWPAPRIRRTLALPRTYMDDTPFLSDSASDGDDEAGGTRAMWPCPDPDSGDEFNSSDTETESLVQRKRQAAARKRQRNTSSATKSWQQPIVGPSKRRKTETNGDSRTRSRPSPAAAASKSASTLAPPPDAADMPQHPFLRPTFDFSLHTDPTSSDSDTNHTATSASASASASTSSLFSPTSPTFPTHPPAPLPYLRGESHPPTAVPGIHPLLAEITHYLRAKMHAHYPSAALAADPEMTWRAIEYMRAQVARTAVEAVASLAGSSVHAPKASGTRHARGRHRPVGTWAHVLTTLDADRVYPAPVVARVREHMHVLAPRMPASELASTRQRHLVRALEIVEQLADVLAAAGTTVTQSALADRIRQYARTSQGRPHPPTTDLELNLLLTHQAPPTDLVAHLDLVPLMNVALARGVHTSRLGLIEPLAQLPPVLVACIPQRKEQGEGVADRQWRAGQWLARVAARASGDGDEAGCAWCGPVRPAHAGGLCRSCVKRRGEVARSEGGREMLADRRVARQLRELATPEGMAEPVEEGKAREWAVAGNLARDPDRWFEAYVQRMEEEGAGAGWCRVCCVPIMGQEEEEGAKRVQVQVAGEEKGEVEEVNVCEACWQRRLGVGVWQSDEDQDDFEAEEDGMES